MGRRRRFEWLLAVGAVALAGCGSSTATSNTPRSATTVASACALRPASGGYVLAGDPAGCNVAVMVGRSLRLELSPVGAPATPKRSYGIPRTADPSVLGPVDALGSCPSGDTCGSFAAHSPGTARITWTGPSGCAAPGGPCVAARNLGLTVTVTPR